MKFIRIQLQNWRNFVAVDTLLADRVFLVGPNAAGKSNFLDAFRFLHDLAAPVAGGFQAAVGNGRGGVSAIRSLAARSRPAIGITCEMQDESGGIWRYELRFDNGDDNVPVVKHERVEHDGKELVCRPDPDDKNDPRNLRQTHLEQTRVNKEFRGVADFFATISYAHIVPQLIRQPDRFASTERRQDPYGADLLEQIAAAKTPEQKRKLKLIANALRIAVPQLQKLELVRDQRTGRPHLRGKYEHWRTHGAWQTEESFSDGTLRLLGLLWLMLDAPGPILLEEPELSLHPEIVRHLPQVMAEVQQHSGRQIICSTHSRDLLRDDGIGMNEVLLLKPQAEGTQIKVAGEIAEVAALLEGGVDMAEAVVPLAGPNTPRQLSLFDNSTK